MHTITSITIRRGWWATTHSRRYLGTLVPSIDHCPQSTCACASMPDCLEIDHKKRLDGTMAVHDRHVIINTGCTDWTSKIEDDPRLPVVKYLKQLIGKNGTYFNPFFNPMISVSNVATKQPLSVTILPSMQHISLANAGEEHNPFDIAESLLTSHILPESLSAKTEEFFASLSTSHLLRKSAQSPFQTSSVATPMVMICGHNARDSRCGILGPILVTEFERQLQSHGIASSNNDDCLKSRDSNTALVTQISHIGGHAFAGNVIVYIPSTSNWSDHALAGKGIWYGRVEPKHVQGIIEKTILGGVVIKELFRGGLDSDSALLKA